MALMPGLSELLARVDGEGDFAIQLYRGFIPIKAMAPENGGDGEWDRAMYLLDIVKRYFDDVKMINANDNRVKSGFRPNIVSLIRGVDESRTFWVIAHMDTVPEGDRSLWSYNPYEATVMGDLVYGRGVEDDGHGIVLGILVAKILKESGVKPPFNYGLILASDEEVGSRYGIRHILSQEPNIIKRTDLVLVPDAGDKTGSVIEVAEKSILWVKVTVIGKQGHASAPGNALNAHRLGAMLMLELDRVLHERFNRQDPTFSPPYSTFEPTKVDKNIDNINTIPGRHTFYIDCRVLPNYSLDEVLLTINDVASDFCRRYGCGFSIEVISRDDTSPATGSDSEIVRRLMNAIKYVKGVEPKLVGIGGGTYARYIRAMGIPVAVWMTSSGTGHMPNEHIDIKDLLSDVKVVLASMLLQPS